MAITAMRPIGYLAGINAAANQFFRLVSCPLFCFAKIKNKFCEIEIRNTLINNILLFPSFYVAILWSGKRGRLSIFTDSRGHSSQP